MFLLNILWNKGLGGECLYKRLKKTFPVLVFFFIEYGRLNQMILRLHLRFSLACGSDGISGTKTGFSWNPHLFKASHYVLMLLFMISSFDYNLEILVLMDLNFFFFIIHGGYFSLYKCTSDCHEVFCMVDR